MTRALVFLMFASVLSAAKVTVLRVPNGGIQPQAAVDPSGVVHLVYFAGEPAHGNLFYVRSRDGGSSFSSPIAVNSHPNSAIATGNVRGARIAQGTARPGEMRTAPLWGLRARGPFLHDGRAATVDAAIRFHDGEAARVRDRYNNLTSREQRQLIEFLNSI